MNISKFGEFLYESDSWSSYHTKDKSYFDELFYNLLEMDYELEVHTFFGKDNGRHFEHSSSPETGYKPAYTLEFYSESLHNKKFTVSDLSIIAELLNEVKAGSKRLEADLGKCYISFEPHRIQITTIESEASDIEIKNEDLLDFQRDVKLKIGRYNEYISIKMTDDGVDLDSSSLSQSQKGTLLKHIRKMKDDEWGHNRSQDVEREDMFQYHYDFDVKSTNNHYILTFNKKVIRYPYRNKDQSKTLK
jgi:hypothetical protein